MSHPIDTLELRAMFGSHCLLCYHGRFSLSSSSLVRLSGSA